MAQRKHGDRLAPLETEIMKALGGDQSCDGADCAAAA